MKGRVWARPRLRAAAFSLTEVVLALGLVAFVLVGILGLFTTGLRSVTDSERRIEAANLASALINQRVAQPNQVIAGSPLPVIELSALPTNAAGSTQSLGFVDGDGKVVSQPGAARFRIVSKVWRDTTFSTNSDLVRLQVQLSWPPSATNSPDVYLALTGFHAAR